MQLDIVTPDRRVVVSDTSDVVIPGKAGEFEVLPGHAPFLTVLGTGILSFVADGKPVRLMVSGGFADVDRDRVVLLCESAALASEVQVDTDRKQLQELEQKLKALGATSPDDEQFLLVQAEVDRAAARLSLTR